MYVMQILNFTMELTLWYSIAIAALAVVLVLGGIGIYIFLFMFKQVKFVFRRYFWYVPLLRRRRLWGSVSLGQGFLVTLYIVLNGFAMGVGIDITNASDLITRTGLLASINTVPLFFGGRTSILAEILGFSFHSYYLAHHWIGRVVVLQSLLHAILVAARGELWTFNIFQVSGISVS